MNKRTMLENKSRWFLCIANSPEHIPLPALRPSRGFSSKTQQAPQSNTHRPWQCRKVPGAGSLTSRASKRPLPHSRPRTTQEEDFEATPWAPKAEGTQISNRKEPRALQRASCVLAEGARNARLYSPRQSAICRKHVGPAGAGLGQESPGERVPLAPSAEDGLPQGSVQHGHAAERERKNKGDREKSHLSPGLETRR